MKLLDPNEIIKDESETTKQAIVRTQKLAVEENRLAKLINKIQTKAKEKIAEINKEIEDYKKSKEVEQKELGQEVFKLEHRKKDALKPINELEEKAQKSLENAKKRHIDVDKLKEKVDAVHEENLDFADKLQDRKDELDERERGIINSEEANKKVQGELKGSTDKLNGDWVKYHKTVNQFNKKVSDLDERERVLNIAEEVVKSREKSQNERNLELRGEDMRNKSERQAIEQAKIHLGIKNDKRK